MLDLDEIRENDLDNGRFDIYTDDIDFTDEQYTELRYKDKVRISDINPVDIDNPEIFEHIKKVTNYIKKVADAVCPNGYKVFDNKIMSYVNVILDAVNKDITCLKYVSEELFKENYLLEAILMRDVVVRFNKYKLEAGENTDDEKLGSYYLEFQDIQSIIEQKKYAKKVFDDNIIFTRILSRREGRVVDNQELTNNELYTKITGEHLDE